MEMAGVTLFRQEKGLVRPDPASMAKLSMALDVSVDWIMNGGPGGPPVDETRPVARAKENASNELPKSIAELWASGRLSVSEEEIAFLARHVRANPGLTADDLEIDLLARRARTTRLDEDQDALNAALERQNQEKKVRALELEKPSPPAGPRPDTVRKTTGRKPRGR